MPREKEEGGGQMILRPNRAEEIKALFSLDRLHPFFYFPSSIISHLSLWQHFSHSIGEHTFLGLHEEAYKPVQHVFFEGKYSGLMTIPESFSVSLVHRAKGKICE